MKKQVIAYLHTHWDREWYREFEVFRMRLLRVFDDILDLLSDNKIPCFYFDGQVAALEDYLEIRPDKRELIRSLIYSKKLFIGPFYCLVDEFLTDRNCFIKNLEIGMETAISLGCTDFIGYLPDTFGHSANVVDILREFGIDKCFVWRGCGDFPSEFRWCGMDTVNLVRGYFHDVFSLNCDIEKKAEILKYNLDMISEKSGEYILLPIGADHLGVPMDIQDQILAVNEILKESYNIRLDSPFEYFKTVGDRFGEFSFDDELRDNSKTFTLQGCYSSRLDLKRLNVESSYKLELASRMVNYYHAEEKYSGLINHAYKMLLQNQAHDSICGCSVDDVHFENVSRYKKILQIANGIIDELKFLNNFESGSLLNLSERAYTGVVEFVTPKFMQGYERFKITKGFDSNLLADTLRIPVTEDYGDLNHYLVQADFVSPDEVRFLTPDMEETDIRVRENAVINSKIKFAIRENNLIINNIALEIRDYADLGDSYNSAPKPDDDGDLFKVIKTKILYSGNMRAVIKVDFEGRRDILFLTATLDRNSSYLHLDFNWTNTQKNHLLAVEFKLPRPIKEVFSEDMNVLIKRNFDPEYDIRKNLPKVKGKEARTNTAPMQRGLIIDEESNNIGIITKGLTQYEVFGNILRIPILRATGVISNPQNPARTTPAGPPLETPDLQMLKNNRAEMYVFFGNKNAFDEVLNQVYRMVIV